MKGFHGYHGGGKHGDTIAPNGGSIRRAFVAICCRCNASTTVLHARDKRHALKTLRAGGWSIGKAIRCPHC